MSTPKHPYIPCLLWRQGEYQAVQDLSPNAKRMMLPLIEIPEYEYDFKARKRPSSLELHISTACKYIAAHWGMAECLVDLRHIGWNKSLSSGQLAMDAVFGELRKSGIPAIPVLALDQMSDALPVLLPLLDTDRRGLAFRIGIESTESPDLPAQVHRSLQAAKLTPEEVDLLLDLRAPSFEPMDGLVAILETTLREFPYLSRWRRLGLLGTAFPNSMGSVHQGESLIPRSEWQLYKCLVARLSAQSIRIPLFGDYGIRHPDFPHLDMRLIKSSATIRYTIPDHWLVVKGKNVRGFGLAQHRGLCRQIIARKEYVGQKFSWGDAYIFACAQGKESTGNLTLWRRVGTNHHLEWVAREVAALAVP
jgi:hypothetical protein